VVASDGSLDRPALAAIVFSDPAALKDLNAIVHPAVGVEILRQLDSERSGDRVVVLDIPLLVESGRYQVAAVVVVDVDPEIAVRRLVSQRGMTETDARARIANQVGREERRAKADRVIDNGGSRQDLERQVDDVWAWMQTLPPAPAR